MEVAKRHFWTVGSYLLVYSLTHGLGVLAGLIYLRYLSVSEYGFYALALTTVTFVALVSDVGLSSALTYCWRRAVSRGEAFISYARQVSVLRFVLFAPALLVGVTGLVVSIGADQPPRALLAVALLIAGTSLAAMLFAMSQTVLRLAGRFRLSYVADISSATVRLLAAFAIILASTPTAILALLGGVAGSVVGACVSGSLLHRIRAALPAGYPPPAARKVVVRYAAPIVPSVLLFALQDTAIYWIAAWKGGTSIVAEAFALARVGSILTVLNGVVTQLAASKLASVADPLRFSRSAWLLRCLMIVVGLVFVALAVFRPEAYLFIVGEKYAHLEFEMALVAATAALHLQTTASDTLNRIQGWVAAEPYIVVVKVVIIASLLAVWEFQRAADICLLLLICAAMWTSGSWAVAVIGRFRPQSVAVSPTD